MYTANSIVHPEYELFVFSVIFVRVRVRAFLFVYFIEMTANMISWPNPFRSGIYYFITLCSFSLRFETHSSSLNQLTYPFGAYHQEQTHTHYTHRDSIRIMEFVMSNVYFALYGRYTLMLCVAVYGICLVVINVYDAIDFIGECLETKSESDLISCYC